ncbi:hypothetical protein DQ04_00071020 [Trypanosoma grayi]|uniref:hypothetical protein n=1 Tax=Trypanosoma grayi TaxID=71804 RepID=UPI0004F446C2|nr:hypothetical protein DQ04_00071020 [Trypanosoma grayi]KEG15434.1 hypothetical protein DQ04_00071020 [Trypanosoma grayi]
MSEEAQSGVQLSEELPILTVRKSGKTIAVVADSPSAKCCLPFSLASCEVMQVTTQDALLEARESGALKLVALEWPIKVKVRVALSAVHGRTHWVVLSSGASGSTTTVSKSFKGTEEGLCEVSGWLKSIELHGSCEMCIASEPDFSELHVTQQVVGHMRLREADEEVNERVMLGDSMSEIAILVEDFLRAYFIDGMNSPTAVFWPLPLTFPVNIHSTLDKQRVEEHKALLLPMRPLLHFRQRLKDWARANELRPMSVASMSRTGVSWEKHLIRDIHKNVRCLSPISGGELFVTSGSYDYYHYRVDGFKDDGWGCAYRSLQTILSWFQYEGLMDKPMPDLRAIQEILAVKDAEKMGRKDFVGSRDWIGSFEIMIVIQHYVPGIECTIRRMESGSDLDTDPMVQQLLVSHFRQKRACPVMIGGSSYAHTILGVDANLATVEARYLVADPHYSSSETSIKTVTNKGYVGWKEAGKFFESNSWYNLCIPQVASYDPR